MAGSLIGNLAILLSMDTAAFEKGNSHAQKLLRNTQREFEKVGAKLQSVGRTMATRLTLPIVGAGAAVIKLASDFETSMNDVSIATQASAGEMKKMRDLALDIGKSTTKSASEASNAMTILAKAGLSTTQILDGAARATVALAEAAGSELDPAAAAITDTIKQFGLTTKDLPQIINQITGAVNESKFDFADFQLGMAQAGGVAASAGVEFEEFAAALAATSSQFASGSDAGTSLKTFLMRLEPDTKKARAAMEQFGFSAFDAQGKLKPLAQVAQDLQDKFGKLSEQDRTAIFKQLFGTDAIRTAIGLMKEGSAGIQEMQDRLNKTDAAAQAAQRMKGFNAELEKLRGAIETAAIAIADSGMLAALTSLVSGLANVIDKLGELSPATLKWVTILAALTAGVGPLLIVVGSVVKTFGVLLPLIVKIVPAFKALVGVMTLARVAGLALIPALAPILIPLGLITAAVAAGYLAWKNWDKIAPIVGRMVGAVKGHLATLGNVLKAVLTPIESVRRGFFNLWDKVVGHSYIPDMVDEIAAQMARLDAVMVAPVTKATSKAAEAFRNLQTEVSGLLNRLFPEAAALNTFKAEVDTLDRAMKKGIITAEQYAEALRRLQTEGLTDEPISVLDTGPLEFGAPDVEGIVDQFEKLNQRTQEWRDILSNVAVDLARMGGDILSGLVDKSLTLKEAFRGLLSYAIQFLTSSQGMNLLAGAFGGARAMGGPVVRGKTYLVGENGPELFSPGTSGQVISNDNLRGGLAGVGGNPTFNIYTNDADSFRRNERQIARDAKRRLAVV